MRWEQNTTEGKMTLLELTEIPQNGQPHSGSGNLAAAKQDRRPEHHVHQEQEAERCQDATNSSR